jgi:hypothetical protein
MASRARGLRVDAKFSAITAERLEYRRTEEGRLAVEILEWGKKRR